jgi:hypothetical protein
MKKLNEIKYWIFLMGILLLNIGTISKYIYPLSDFINGVTKGIGIVCIVWFISVAYQKQVREKTSNS